MSTITLAQATELLSREAHCLDRQDWDAWLALYWPDAEFWLPAWTDTHTTGDSPDTTLSLIYCAGRGGLEDRVWRIRSGLSVASKVLPRTAHAIACPLFATPPLPDEAEIHANWTCHVYEPKRSAQHVFFGRYEVRLAQREGRWGIARKKVILMNDLIPTMIDVYCV